MKMIQIIDSDHTTSSKDDKKNKFEVLNLQGDLQKWHFWFWSQRFRKWPLEVTAHEELVQILGLGKPLGSLGKNQSESKVPRLQGDLQKWLMNQIFLWNNDKT